MTDWWRDVMERQGWFDPRRKKSRCVWTLAGNEKDWADVGYKQCASMSLSICYFSMFYKSHWLIHRQFQSHFSQIPGQPSQPSQPRIIQSNGKEKPPNWEKQEASKHERQEENMVMIVVHDTETAHARQSVDGWEGKKEGKKERKKTALKCLLAL